MRSLCCRHCSSHSSLPPDSLLATSPLATPALLLGGGGGARCALCAPPYCRYAYSDDVPDEEEDAPLTLEDKAAPAEDGSTPGEEGEEVVKLA